jgi:hypothetical protein
MILLIVRAAIKMKSPSDLSPLPDKAVQNGLASTKKAMVLMGVIFILMGSFIPFGQPAQGVPHWMGWIGGGMFVSAGIGIILALLENKIYAKLFVYLAVLLLMAIFNWISFAPGERIGSSTNFLGITHGNVSVKNQFAIFTGFFDLILLLIVIGKLWKLRKK